MNYVFHTNISHKLLTSMPALPNTALSVISILLDMHYWQNLRIQNYAGRSRIRKNASWEHNYYVST